ncbi:MAG: type II toxin-antitoxin system Phd/YefM family antitoxin [Methylococcales bacterium]|nr:type II toxin-antitoxin system Phd/YefM family antitoxin [Methylococcales bacterium]
MLANVSVNKFRSNLRSYIEQVTDTHQPLRVTRHNTSDFIVVSVEDWEREQETLYVLQNRDLRQKLEAAIEAKANGVEGHQPTSEELDAFLTL